MSKLLRTICLTLAVFSGLITPKVYSAGRSDFKWQRDFLEGLQWGMHGDQVNNILSNNGYTMTLVDDHWSGAWHIHTSEIRGQIIYGRVRVQNIKIRFLGEKLWEISFQSVHGEKEGLYNLSNNLFGPALIQSYPANDEVKSRVPSPRNNYKAERYSNPGTTKILNQLQYSWDGKKYNRSDSIILSDWPRQDKVYGHNSIPRVNQHAALVKNKLSGGDSPCEKCNGSGRCISCNGKGSSYETRWIKCYGKYCRGRGRYKVNGFGGGIRTCATCQGSGKVAKGKEKVNCSKCKGTGDCIYCSQKK